MVVLIVKIMDFESLVRRINQVQDVLQAQAAYAVNLALTTWNWLVGYYIVEFEQHGEDRAKYGDKLINRLAERLNHKGFNPRHLRNYRHLYQVYPILGEVISRYLMDNHILSANSDDFSIWLFSTAKLQLPDNQENVICLSKTAKLEKWQTPSDKLFYRLNYTILSYWATIDDPLKRAFYEQETIRGCRTQKELDRQVSSQYYERMGLSKDKKALQRLAVKNALQLAPRNILHNPITLITARLPYDTPPRGSRRIFSSANTVSCCRRKMTSSNICWRTYRKRSSGN